MNILEEEIWVTHPQHVCLISKLDQEINKLYIIEQGIKEIDKVIQQDYTEQVSNIKVDILSKQGINDLLVLNELNEFNCLHGIRVRYSKQQIYTQVGLPILVAINPYKFIQSYYDQTAINSYKSQMEKLNQIPKDILQQKLRDVEPHLFKVAQLSLSQLFEDTSKDQRICSMIISGESGSGKTESTKYILKYLAAETKVTTNKTITIEQKVFASNPVLEAFGNAKTARNDNSSRFGKFIHIYFNPINKKITSALIDNYLLEKSRVVKLSPVERNYHIFYQLIAAQIPELKLGLAKQYNYLKYGDLKFDKNELEEFNDTNNCMDKMNFSALEKKYIFQILAGILHLGNITIQGDANKSFIIEDFSQKVCCQLLGLTSDQLSQVICKVLTLMGKENILKDNNITAAQSARDTLAKYIYEKLFDWLIEKVNTQLYMKDDKNQNKYMIGILDIFGFEIFTDEQGVHTNSFEQLNINFTNEKLQQHFNQNMLESEQYEYSQEGISWSHIKFPDNKAIIDVIENPSLSIFKLLIDQTIAPKGNDKEFHTSFKNLPKENITLLSDLQTADLDSRIDKKAHRFVKFDWFCVKHFAGCVIYNVAGFVEKNKDSINQEIHTVLPSSTNPIIREIWKSHQITITNMKSNNVITRFQKSLTELLDILNKSMPKYIRCIKPNNNKAAFEFDSQEVRRQMRQAGLMEAIQIRKAGYEIRISHEEFMKKYRFLIKGKATDIKNMINLLMQNSKIQQKLEEEFQNKNVQLGFTKIFMKESFRDFLDQKLIEFRYVFIIRIQKAGRRYIYIKTIIPKLKLLIKRFHFLQRQIKWFIFKFILERRIINRKIFNALINIINKIQYKILKQTSFQKINQYIIIKKQEEDKINLAKKELENELKIINNSNDIQEDIINSQPLENENSSILLSQSLYQSKSYIKTEISGTQNSIEMYKKALIDTQQKLKQEQQKRRELENEVEKLQHDLNQFETTGRETLTGQAMGQFEDIFALSQLTEEKQQLEYQLEAIKLEKKNNEKKLILQIQQLEIDLQQTYQVNKQLQLQYDKLTEEYLIEIKQKEEIEEKFKDEWNTEKRQLMREIEDLKKQLSNQIKISNKELQKIQTELEKEKLKRIESENETKKQKQLSDLYINQIQENESSSNIKSQGNHELQLKELQIKDLEVEIQKRDQTINSLQSQLFEQTKQLENSKEQLTQSINLTQSLPNEQNQELNEKIGLLQISLKKREQVANHNKKLITVMNNLIKLKILEINALHKHFNIQEQQKHEIYKGIQPIMDKEKLLMKQFEQLIKQNTVINEEVETINQQQQ